MEVRDRLANAIRKALDETGNELTWSDVYAAAAAVEEELADELERAWIYEDLANS